MKNRRGSGTVDLLPWLLVAMSLLFARPLRAADTGRQESITLNAGESQVIDNLNPDSHPTIKVIENSHALVVHNEDPAKLVLLGAEKGKWSIAVKLKDGEEVTYLVNVDAIRSASAPLSPGVAPSAMTDEVAKNSAPAISPLDSGTGLVVKPATGNEKIGAAPQVVVTSDPAEAAKIGEAEHMVPGSSATQNSPVIPSQGASASIERAAKFTTDPSVASSGESYTTDGVASSGGSHFLPADGISMMNGTSQVIDFPQRMRRVSIADTEIADVQVINPFELNLIGHKPGFTTLTVWTGQGHYEERQVRISPNGKQQVLLNTMVAEVNRGQVENQGANLSLALQKAGISFVSLPGAVANPYNPGVNITGPQSGLVPQAGNIIPLLISQGMTYGVATGNGNSNLTTQSFFQYLENHNMAKILAQPRLLANSGEKAKFVDGGEIPIVVAQALNTSIVFKEFGTKVTFVPTVVGVNDIELLVEPEVSEPDFAHGVSLFGFTVPAFVVRRAETQVRLRDNQTLIVAGLILHEKKQIIQKVPYLGDIPYVSGLFKNTDWEDTETDLVISVAPEIVRPLPSGGQVYLPTTRPPLSVDEIKTERLATPDAARPRF